MKKGLSRRNFLTTVTTATIATAVAGPVKSFATGWQIHHPVHKKLAILGGMPVRKAARIGPPWPYVDDKMVEAIVHTTKSRVWSRIQSRDGTVPTFEKAFASLIGSNYSIGTGSGTQSLSTCMFALGIGPGDEVITSPYTDMGTISSILTSGALPVLIDLDPESYQMDADLIERRINKNTKAIMPVHIFGVAANMDKIMAIAKKYGLRVIEDACQAPLARYRGKGLGTIGDLGCFSFQASKAIACGEGGAVVGNNEELMDKCYTVHNRGASRKGSNETIGPKYRMNEFEGAILMGQFPGIKERFHVRNENAGYLSNQLKDFTALAPQKHYAGSESGAYYHYGMTYRKEHWGIGRAQFLKALAAEGVNMGTYIRTGLHREPWVDHILGLKSYQDSFSATRLREYKQSLDLPVCDRVTDETMVSFAGSGALLAPRTEMENIIQAIMKVYENREQLKTV